MPILLLPLGTPCKWHPTRNMCQVEYSLVGNKIIGSFEKAVPVIFKPRGVRRPLFPWLLTGLHSFPWHFRTSRRWRHSNVRAKRGAATHENQPALACGGAEIEAASMDARESPARETPIVKPRMQRLSTCVPARRAACSSLP